MTLRRAALMTVVGLAFAGCSDDGDGRSTGDAGGVVTTSAPTDAATTTADPGTTAAAPATTGQPAASPATASPTSVAATTAPATPAPTLGEPVVASDEIGSFDSPVGLAVRPGDAALYVIEQAGRVVRFDVASGDTRTVADIADGVSFGGEQGLLGLAFAPDGARAYLDFTNDAGDTNVVEYRVGADGTFDTTAARLLIEIAQPYGNHNGGDLALGPDGTLYIALGDGGDGGDPQRRASDPTTRLGALLRIDPTPSGTSPYTIPADNPFADGPFDGVDGAPEVWAWGLRNPWRFDIDPVSADLWIADVGQGSVEEVDVVSPTDGQRAGRGANFGWSAFEGDDRYNDDVEDPGDLVFPVHTYAHGDDGCSISGGAVYRGTAIEQLEPAFVYGDYCSGRLWAVDPTGNNIELLDGFDEMAGVDRGPDGELYVIERSGGIHRLVPG